MIEFIKTGGILMCIISVIALILVLIGAINWGFIGFFNINFVNALLGGAINGDYTMWERVVYAIVGLAGIWALSFLGRLGSFCKSCCCKKGGSCKKDR